MRQMLNLILGNFIPRVARAGSAQTALHPRHHVKAPRVAAGPESASAGDAAAAKPGTAGTANWATRCSSATRGAPLDCSIEQSAVLTKTGQLIVLVSIRIPAQPRSPVILVQIPLGVFLPAACGCRWTTAMLRRLPCRRANSVAVSPAAPFPPIFCGADQRAQSEGLVPGSAAPGAEHFAAARRFRPGLREDQIADRFDSISSGAGASYRPTPAQRASVPISEVRHPCRTTDKLDSSIQSPIFGASWVFGEFIRTKLRGKPVHDRTRIVREPSRRCPRNCEWRAKSIGVTGI